MVQKPIVMACKHVHYLCVQLSSLWSTSSCFRHWITCTQHTHIHTHTLSLSLQADVKSIWLAASEHLLASPNTTYPTSASISHLKVFSLKVPPSLSLPSETQLMAVSGIWVSTLMTLLPSSGQVTPLSHHLLYPLALSYYFPSILTCLSSKYLSLRIRTIVFASTAKPLQGC